LFSKQARHLLLYHIMLFSFFCFFFITYVPRELLDFFNVLYGKEKSASVSFYVTSPISIKSPISFIIKQTLHIILLDLQIAFPTATYKIHYILHFYYFDFYTTFVDKLPEDSESKLNFYFLLTESEGKKNSTCSIL